MMLAVAFSGFSISNSIPMVVGFRLIQGCGMAFGNACCLVMVADMLPKDKYNSGLGYYSLAHVVSGAVGPSVGLALVDAAGFRVTYTLTACLMLLAAFLTLQLRIDFKRTKKLKLAFNNIIAMEAILPVGVNFIMVLGGAGVSSFLFIFARGQGVAGNIGLYFTISALTMLVTRPFLGKLTDKYGITRVAIPALSFNVISMFIISYSTTLAGFLSAAVVSAFGQGAFGPAIQALTMKAVPTDRRGAASSTNYIGMDLGSMLGPLAAGQVAHIFGYTLMWRIMVIPFIIAAIVLVVFRKNIIRIEKDFAAM
jgi:MFS family permease